ncbi:hypothetical protein ACFCVY_15060 [Streptomyces sp. NPDC056411]|uniref:hypothetical protein n=1 Tax=Streptomyces sp. NPDC056411 TaxID=3345813 RepID=UPI0035D8B859
MSSPSAPTATAGPASPLRPHGSWWTVGAAALLAGAALASALWISAHLHPDPALHATALFLHLASMVLGFGAVLVVDYYALLWLTSRCSLAEALTTAGRLHAPVWAGLAGLVVTGAVLHPDLDSSLTRTKLALVLLLTLNGLQARVLTHRLTRHSAPALPPRLLAWGAVTATLSQLCWWGAVTIGFLNTHH